MTQKKEGKPNQFLRQARIDEGLTQQQLADKIDTLPITIGRWERGETFPGPFFREKLCTFFHKSNEQLGLLHQNYLHTSQEEEEANQSKNQSGLHISYLTLLNTTPAKLVKRDALIEDTLTEGYFLNWIMPCGAEAQRSYEFTTNGLSLLSQEKPWPLAICFAQAIPLVPLFALQVDMTFLQTESDPLRQSGGIAFGVKEPLDHAPMKRIRIGSDGTYDIYVESDNRTFSGRLHSCPDITDPDAQSTLRNNDDTRTPTSPAIRQGINKTNSITVVVVERFITLYVNGQKLQTVCDRQPNAGMIGLFAGAPYKDEVTEVLFTNLKYWIKF